MTYSLERRGLHWVVVDATGARVSGHFIDYRRAQDRLAGLRRKAAVIRRACMCCARTFDSEGAHNRLCDTCRQQDNYMDLSSSPTVELVRS